MFPGSVKALAQWARGSTATSDVLEEERRGGARKLSESFWTFVTRGLAAPRCSAQPPAGRLTDSNAALKGEEDQPERKVADIR